MGMMMYSGLLALALVVSAPWWIWRMASSGRYRAGLPARLGWVSADLARAVQGRDVVWVHAVSVGEVLAAETLVRRMQAALPGWVIALSTTTLSGQTLARERLKEFPVFYLPLDFAYAVRRYLKVLRPKLMVLMESELWPRMLHECARRGVKVAVVNARVSDRSLSRYLRLRALWRPLLAKVDLFLAQGDESAERLRRIGAPPDRTYVTGNLKYDAPVEESNAIVEALRPHLPERAEVLVCGSTMEGEEVALFEAWEQHAPIGSSRVLIVAPRHPERFEPVMRLAGARAIRLSEWMKAPRAVPAGAVMVLDSLGSLAAVYGLATAAFVGGSLVPKGGHNPLEAARFGVPVMMGPFYENFREMVDAMRAADAIRIVEPGSVAAALKEMMSAGQATGSRGKAFFEAQTGATEKTLAALLALLPKAQTR